MNNRRSTVIGTLTRLFLLVITGLLSFTILSCSSDSPNPAPTARGIPAKETPPNGQQYAPKIQISETTSQEAQLELLNKAAIELCKAETVKQQPNAKDYVAHGRWFQVSQKDTFHVQVDWTLGGIDPAIVSDCRIVRKNDKMAVVKIKFTFSN